MDGRSLGCRAFRYRRGGEADGDEEQCPQTSHDDLSGPCAPAFPRAELSLVDEPAAPHLDSGYVVERQ